MTTSEKSIIETRVIFLSERIYNAFFFSKRVTECENIKN